MFFGDQRHRLLLAINIGEWATALDHIEASIRTGLIMPVPYATLNRVRTELRDLLNQWSAVTERLLQHPDDDARMVEEARAYCTEHQAEIDELLNETKGES
jgi:hypothetical protein